MTRTGKIARLPRHIRDQLNQRLENGEPGVHLLEWLNSLPEVKKVLELYFEGRAITSDNLTDWKNGGFPDWQTQRDIDNDLANFRAERKELGDVADEIAGDMEVVSLARYAVTLQRAKGEITGELQAQLQCLSRSLRDVVRFRRSQQTRERTRIQQETLDLKRQLTDEGRRKKFLELANDPRITDQLTPRMTHEERARLLEQICYPERFTGSKPTNPTA